MTPADTSPTAQDAGEARALSSGTFVGPAVRSYGNVSACFEDGSPRVRFVSEERMRSGTNNERKILPAGQIPQFVFV